MSHSTGVIITKGTITEFPGKITCYMGYHNTSESSDIELNLTI